MRDLRGLIIKIFELPRPIFISSRVAQEMNFLEDHANGICTICHTVTITQESRQKIVFFLGNFPQILLSVRTKQFRRRQKGQNSIS